LALELWRPGITLSLGQRIAQNIINKIRQPIVFEGFGNSPLLITIILLGLGTLVTMLYQYWQSGLLGSLEVNLLLALLFRLILLPLVLVVMLIRSPIFYRLESQCLQSSV
ncbi:MAG: hypothetical protein RLZZ490_2053, partial [Cyanobacteriota bacterium]